MTLNDRSPLQQRRRKKSILGMFLILATLSVVTILIFSVIESIKQNPELDSETLCRTEGGPTVFWAVVIDPTDSFNAFQRAFIMKRFEEIKDSIPRFGMLAVFVVPESAEQALTPIIGLCNPGTGAEVSKLTGNPELVKRKWQKGYDLPLRRILDTLLVKPSSRQSPIMQTLQAVTLHGSAYRDVERRIFLFSDMLQHTPDYTQYGSRPPNFEQFRNSMTYGKVRTNLVGWKITTFYARRGDSASRLVQGRSHMQFWDEYFNDMGGELMRVIWIEG